MSTQKVYDDQQRATFVELAQNIGIGRAIRELGFPSYPTAQSWVRAAGVKPNTDTAYAQIKDWHTFYQVEDLLIVIDEGISVAQDMLLKAETPDDVKKLSESIQKLANTRQMLEGKATSITEKREVSAEDTEFEKALREFRASDTPRVSEPMDDLM
mgnify:CR=1 FL=1